MKKVAVINYKGGVGKTTVTANLAAELAWRGYKVLLIDLDPQSNLTFEFIRPEEWESDFANDRTIKKWFDSISEGGDFSLERLIFFPDRVTKKLDGRGQLGLVSSHLTLINVDLELATALGGASMKQVKQKYIKVHGHLSSGLSQIDDNRYDLVLFDCPPNFNIVTKNAIIASDNILIPAKPDYLSTLGIDYLHRSVKTLIREYNEFASSGESTSADIIEPEILGVIFTMVQFYAGKPISTLRQFISQTKALDIPVFESYIRENKSLFGESRQDGVPVILNEYTNKVFERVKEELEFFVTEFVDEMSLENSDGDEE